MPSSKQQSIKNETDELFRLSVRSDGTVAVMLDRRFDIFPVAPTSVIAKQIEVGYSERHTARSDELYILKTYNICGMQWVWPQFPAPSSSYHSREDPGSFGIRKLGQLERFSQSKTARG
jgi:hypothetical protein